MGNSASDERDEWDVVQGIGTGAFGSVMAVRRNDPNIKFGTPQQPGEELYAMKCISKGAVLENDALDGTLAEMILMSETPHSPFVLQLHSAFQDKGYLYLITDLCDGGSLSQLIKANGTLSSGQAKFLFAELVMALEHLHGHGIVHMDIKPSNCLLGARGHLKVADFNGARRWPHFDSKFDPEHGQLFGTSGYIAPEVLAKRPGFTVSAPDWWSAGMCLFQMLHGRRASPWDPKGKKSFQSWSAELEAILKQRKPLLSKSISEQERSVLAQLLQVDYRERLCSRKNATELKRHAYFEGYPWDRAKRCEIKVPYQVQRRAFADENKKKTNEKWLSESIKMQFLLTYDITPEEQLLFKNWHCSLDKRGQRQFGTLEQLAKMNASEVRRWISRQNDPKIWEVIESIKKMSELWQQAREELTNAREMNEMMTTQNDQLKQIIREMLSDNKSPGQRQRSRTYASKKDSRPKSRSPARNRSPAKARPADGKAAAADASAKGAPCLTRTASASVPGPAPSTT